LTCENSLLDEDLHGNALAEGHPAVPVAYDNGTTPVLDHRHRGPDAYPELGEPLIDPPASMDLPNGDLLPFLNIGEGAFGLGKIDRVQGLTFRVN